MFSKSKKSQMLQLWSDYSINPRGELWKKDKQNFGHKLLKKMGWQKGEGLGKNGTGISEPIRLVQTHDNEGIGYGARKWDYSWNWLSHQDDYTTLLNQLQHQHSEPSESQPVDSSNLSASNHDIADLEKKARRSRKRVNYQRNIKGKNMKNRSQADWNCILGIKRKNNLPEDMDNTLKTDNCQDRLAISPISSHTYFMEKRLRMEEKDETSQTVIQEGGEFDNLVTENLDVDTEQNVPVISQNEYRKKGNKKRKEIKLFKQRVSSPEQESVQDEPLELRQNNRLEKENHCGAEDSLIVLRKAKKIKKRRRLLELRTILDLTNIEQDSATIGTQETLETANDLQSASEVTTSIRGGILKTRSETDKNTAEIVQKKSVTFLDKPLVGFVPAKDSVRGGAWIWKKKIKSVKKKKCKITIA